ITAGMYGMTDADVKPILFCHRQFNWCVSIGEEHVLPNRIGGINFDKRIIVMDFENLNIVGRTSWGWNR
ncbi:hypothetical protein S245_045215, partial [Arachis hypogaea]